MYTDKLVDIVVVSTCHMNINIHLGGATTNDVFKQNSVGQLIVYTYSTILQ